MSLGINLPPSTITDTYEENYQNLSASAGVNTTTFTAVPTGEVWIIEGASAYDVTTKISAVSIRLSRGGNTYVLARLAPTAAYDAVSLITPIVLFPGDAMDFIWHGCTLNDDIFAAAVGIKLSIDLGI